MSLSDEGKRLIYSFEGLHTKRKDGKYQAYLCPAHVPTIYCGLTHGVKLGMVVTVKEGEAMFAKEIAKFEAAVDRLVKVPLNTNERDALISFSYNVGEGALSKSTLLRKLNKGDRLGAAREFSKWTRGGGRVLPGLVSRRAREQALFMKPTEKPEDPYMPQAVETVAEPVSRTAVGVSVATASTMLPLIGPDIAPAVPAAVSDVVANAENWTDIGGRLWTLKSFAHAQPILALLLLAVCAALWLWPRRAT